ncbi:hypothetical protein, partial [Sporisorium scitamineum]
MTTIEAGACGPGPAPLTSPFTATSESGPSSRPDGPSHRCPFEGCFKSYTKASKLAQHIRSHTGKRPFVCDHPGCGASYMRNEHLKAHQRRHLDPSEKPFACEQEGCGLRFWTSSQLKNHVQACHVDHMFSATGASAHDYACTELGCDMAFHKRKHLRQHIRDHHSSALTLDRQDVEASVKEELERASTATALPFACQFPGCGKFFATNSKRKTHYRTHERGRYTCSMNHSQPQQAGKSQDCSMVYTFPTWSALQAHMKEAHPPICPWPGCGKQFQRQDNLRAHYRRHEDRKLRLEMEAKLLEGSHENQLNHLRADLSDDSYASMSEEEQEDDPESPAANFLEDQRPQEQIFGSQSWQQQSVGHGSSETLTGRPSHSLTQHSSLSSTSIGSPALSEEQLINKAVQLHSTRPRRGGVFRNLSSPALSVITSVSGKTASARLGSIATFAHKHLVSRHRRVCTGVPSSPEQGANGGSRLRFSTSDGNVQKVAEDESSCARSGTDQDDTSNLSSETGSEEDRDQDDQSPATQTANETTSAVKPRLLDLL